LPMAGQYEYIAGNCGLISQHDLVVAVSAVAE
jgi:hypothetical protein